MCLRTEDFELYLPFSTHVNRMAKSTFFRLPIFRRWLLNPPVVVKLAVNTAGKDRADLPENDTAPD
jgi:hypothetical protein